MLASRTDDACRLKKVQAKKKRDAAQAEERRAIEAAPPAPDGPDESSSNLLATKDEDIIF